MPRRVFAKCGPWEETALPKILSWPQRARRGAHTRQRCYKLAELLSRLCTTSPLTPHSNHSLFIWGFYLFITAFFSPFSEAKKTTKRIISGITKIISDGRASAALAAGAVCCCSPAAASTRCRGLGEETERLHHIRQRRLYSKWSRRKIISLHARHKSLCFHHSVVGVRAQPKDTFGSMIKVYFSSFDSSEQPQLNQQLHVFYCNTSQVLDSVCV